MVRRLPDSLPASQPHDRPDDDTSRESDDGDEEKGVKARASLSRTLGPEDLRVRTSGSGTWAPVMRQPVSQMTQLTHESHDEAEVGDCYAMHYGVVRHESLDARSQSGADARNERILSHGLNNWRLEQEMSHSLSWTLVYMTSNDVVEDEDWIMRLKLLGDTIIHASDRMTDDNRIMSRFSDPVILLSASFTDMQTWMRHQVVSGLRAALVVTDSHMYRNAVMCASRVTGLPVLPLVHPFVQGLDFEQMVRQMRALVPHPLPDF